MCERRIYKGCTQARSARSRRQLFALHSRVLSMRPAGSGFRIVLVAGSAGRKRTARSSEAFVGLRSRAVKSESREALNERNWHEAPKAISVVSQAVERASNTVDRVREERQHAGLVGMNVEETAYEVDNSPSPGPSSSVPQCGQALAAVLLD